jgi:peptidyl-prolyl cis-trans isomerase C
MGRTEVEEDAIIAALLDQAIEPDLPSDEECRRYYEARRDRFRTPDLFEVSHILVEPEGDGEAAWSEAEGRARLIAGEVGDDPAAFAEAAREFSACPSSRQDGSLGQVRRGDLVPQIQAAVEALTPGRTMQEPVRSRFGWHVLRLQRRIDGQVLPFKAVHSKVAEMLAARSWTVASTRYVAALAARAEIEGITIEAVG